MSIILILFLVVFFGSIVTSVVLVKKGHSARRVFAMHLATFIISCICFAGATFAVSAVSGKDDDENVISTSINNSSNSGTMVENEIKLQKESNKHWNSIAAAIAIGVSAIGCGLAISAAAPAAIGALTEDPKTFGKSIAIVGICESIIILGLVVAALIMFL